MIIIHDHQIVHVNRSKAGNEADSLIYRDESGALHQIDFDVCARNYAEVNQLGSGYCIGERNIEEGYFLLFTSGIKTKIIFQKAFTFRFQNYFLYGKKRQRFWQLQKLLMETKYSTYDLT